MSRLTISLEINPERDTIQDAITSITEALSLYGRQNGGVLGPWLESRREARGILNHRHAAAGTWRVVDGETKPEEIAETIFQRFGPVELTPQNVRMALADAIREDRKLAARIIPDPDF